MLTPCMTVKHLLSPQIFKLTKISNFHTVNRVIQFYQTFSSAPTQPQTQLSGYNYWLQAMQAAAISNSTKLLKVIRYSVNMSD